MRIRQIAVAVAVAVVLLGAWVSGYSARGSEPIRAVLGLLIGAAGAVLVAALLYDLAWRVGSAQRDDRPVMPSRPGDREGRG